MPEALKMTLDAEYNPSSKRYEVTGIIYAAPEDGRAKQWAAMYDYVFGEAK